MAVVARGSIIDKMLMNEDRYGMHSLPQARLAPAIARELLAQVRSPPITFGVLQ
jgi:hypothetical protein